jgi:hypothetical protein
MFYLHKMLFFRNAFFLTALAMPMYAADSPKSPEERVVLSLICMSACSGFAWFTCQLWTGNQANSWTCVPAVVEAAAFTAVAIPHYHWREEEWDVVKQHLGFH